MIVRHYKATKRPRKRMHPDKVLDMALEARVREADSREKAEYGGHGVGMVSPPLITKATRPKYVPRNDGYYRPNGRRLGARYTTQEAGYLEFTRDVERVTGRRHRKSTPKATSATVIEAATIKNDHDYTTH